MPHILSDTPINLRLDENFMISILIKKFEISQNRPLGATSFSILISNVDQLTNKLQELRSLMYQKDYDLVLLTEVCPKNSRTRLEDSHINMPGYQVISNLSCTGRKCSVLALIKNTYAVHELSIEANSASIESVWFDLTDEDQHQCPLRVGCIYQILSSPSAIETENTLLLMFCLAIENFKGNFIVGDDINFPELIWKDRYPYNPTASNLNNTRPFIEIVHYLSA